MELKQAFDLTGRVAVVTGGSGVLCSALAERGQRIIAHTPMGRLGQPEDLVGPALFLLSDVAQFVHGTTLIVDGGISAFGGV